MEAAQVLIAVAAVVNVLAVAVLVGVTIHYARTTAKILEESRKSREAAERQAAAAEESIRAFRQQIEEQAGLSRTIVASAIQSAIRNIEYWSRANVFNLACTHAIPANIDLVPDNSRAAVEHARRISVDGSVELSGAFDNLRSARTEIEILRDAKQTPAHFYEKHSQEALKYLGLAKPDLDAAQGYFQEAVSHIKP